MDSNTPIFKSRDAVYDTGRTLRFKDSNVNNLVTSDQTNIMRKTENGRRSLILNEIDATRCEFVGSRQVGFCVDRYTSHVFFSHAPVSQVRISLHPHAIHDVTCLSVRLLSLRVCLFPVSLPLPPCLFHCLLVLYPAHNLQCRHRRGLKPLHSRTMRSIAQWRYTIISQGYEPKLLDNFDYSETSAMIFQDESGDIDTGPSYSCDAELDDEIIGKARYSPLFFQEREEPANLRQAYHTHEESLLSAQSTFAHRKYGETRIRILFVPKTQIKSRNGERKNQDSL